MLIFLNQDFLDKHGPPCSPEIQGAELTNQNNNSSVSDEQVKNAPASKFKKVSSEHEVCNSTFYSLPVLELLQVQVKLDN